VVLEIVKTCSELAKRSGSATSDPERVALSEFQQQADDSLSKFEVDLHQVARVTANSQGSFSATVTIPDNVIVRAPSHHVSAHGRTSARADRLPIHILQ
jgi:hypothetical protein